MLAQEQETAYETPLKCIGAFQRIAFEVTKRVLVIRGYIWKPLDDIIAFIVLVQLYVLGDGGENFIFFFRINYNCSTFLWQGMIKHLVDKKASLQLPYTWSIQ